MYTVLIQFVRFLRMRGKVWFFIRVAICLFIFAVTWNFLQCEIFKPIRETFDEYECDIHSSKLCFMNNKLSDMDSAKPVVVAVVCDNRTNEILVMIKSALITSKMFIKFLLFADDSAISILNETIKLWPQKVLNRMSLDLRSLDFPADNAKEWKHLFKPCAAQRLFLPSLLNNVDSVLYLDIDTLFLSSPLKVWEHFTKMNETQMVATAPEHEDFSAGGYNKFTNHPYYGEFGINSGVMLMNLTRMRKFGWKQYVISMYHEYKDALLYGDQDIINIIFHYHPEKLYIYPCNYNYRSDHCTYSNMSPKSVCKTVKEQGIHVLHGNRGIFHNKNELAFKAVYSTFEEHSFEEDLQTLATKMKKSLIETLNTDCGKFIFNSLAASLTL